MGKKEKENWTEEEVKAAEEFLAKLRYWKKNLSPLLRPKHSE